MNKIIATFLTSVIASFSLSYANTDEGQLVVWVPEHKSHEGLRKLGKKFEEDTGIKVVVENLFQVEVKFMQEALRGKGPDIMMWAHDRFGEWADTKLISPVNLSDNYKKKFYDFTLDAVKIKGQYYGYPLAVEAVGLLCNKKIVSENPKNFEDFRELGDKLKAEGKNIYPLVYDYKDSYYTYPLISANGGYVFKKTKNGYDINDIGVNNEGSKIGLTFLRQMIVDDYIPKGADFGVMETMFRKGKAACIITGPWTLDQYDELGMDISLSVLPKLNGKPAKAFVGILSLGINSNSSNKASAKKFIEEYMLTDEGIKYLNDDKNLGAVALKSSQKIMENYPKNGARAVITMKNGENGEIMPNITEMVKFWPAFYTAIRNATLGRQTVDEALLSAERRIAQ